MAIAKDPKVIMNEQQLVERLTVIKNRKTYYKNKYPDNLCYIHADYRTSADCVNLIKAVLNGYDVYKNQIGYYQKDLSNTGDCTEAELLSQCTDVSQDFKALGSHPEILYQKGHVGVYLGQNVQNRWNVIECTPSFGGGVVYSWVDQDGTRRSENGGKPIIMSNGTYNRWTHHGRPSRWVSESYTASKPVQEKPAEPQDEYPVLKKGSKGEAVKKLQKLLKDHGCDPKGIDGDFGNNTLAALKKFQEKAFVTGVADERTWRELYK